MESSLNNSINVTNYITDYLNNTLINEFGYNSSTSSINFANVTNAIIDSVSGNNSFQLNLNHTLYFTDKQEISLKLYRAFNYIIGSFIIISNLIVVVSSGLIVKNRHEPRNAYILLGNVSLADAIFGISLILNLFLPLKFSSYSLCVFKFGLFVSTSITAVYSVGLIAIDRYLFILHGLHYQMWVKKSRIRLMIAGTWILGLGFGFLPLTGWPGDNTAGKYCEFHKVYPPKLVIINSIVRILPIVFVCIFYSIILYNAIKKVTQLQQSGKTQGPSGGEGETKLRVFRGKGQIILNNRIPTVSLHASETNVNVVDETETTIDMSKEDIQKPWKKLKNFFTLKNYKKPLLKEASPSDLSKWKALKIVLFTVGSFIIAWMPLFITMFMLAASDCEKTPEYCKQLYTVLVGPLRILTLLNGVLNPVIYAWWHPGFKKSIKTICVRIRCFRRK